MDTIQEFIFYVQNGLLMHFELSTKVGMLKVMIKERYRGKNSFL